MKGLSRALLIAAALGAAAGSGRTAVSHAEETLGPLLARLARVARLYRDTALQFACKETISWRGMNVPPDRETFSYIFVHGDDGLVNYRTFTGWTLAASRTREVHPTAPIYLHNALLWTMIFSESRQELYHYRLMGEEAVLGRPAVKIEFEPVPPIRSMVNDWYGTAWIDRDTSQILQVEAYEPEGHAAKKLLESHVAGGSEEARNYQFSRYVTEYSVIRNGMRFPGKVNIHLLRYKVRPSKGRPRSSEKLLLDVTHTYRTYEFYSVRTEQEIRGFVQGETGLGR